jgi:Holliday junction resolvase RusA-like endonuclease
MVAMGASEPLKTPLEAFIYISYPVPASYSKTRTKDCLEGLERPTKKPDIDNVIKAYLDSMNKIIYLDDTQIVELHSTKVYGEPFVEVIIKEIT